MRRPVLLYACFGVDTQSWLAALRSELPEVDVREYSRGAVLDDVDFAFVWQYPPGLLGDLTKVRAVFSLGAGVESMLADPDLPADVPLVRMVDAGLAVGMNEFVLMRVLHYHRQMPEYEQDQRAHRWVPRVPPLPEDRRIGILGLGELGSMCARTLAGLGFDVAGWSRSRKSLPGISAFAGIQELRDFLQRTEILVCLLPLTPQTDGIINRDTLAMLPRGAFLINAARGRHVVDEDLVAALDSGQLAGATLDTFRTEPLPTDHPFWTHPRITVVPHIAAVTQVRTAARTLAANVRAMLTGRAPSHQVDRARGY